MSATELEIRAAEPAGAPAIAAIQNRSIEERQSTFDTKPRGGAEVEAAIAQRPTLVAVDGGRVVGWARLSPFSERDCYAGVREASIYLDRDARGGGLGRRLLEALIAEAERLGCWKVIGLLFPENRASVALFDAAGFRVVGVYERHGRLDGDWRDVVLVERLVGEGTA